MIETFNKIINNQSFEIVGSLPVIQRKNFLNEVIRSHDLMGLTFAHLTFLDYNFIDINFRHTNFISSPALKPIYCSVKGILPT